MFAEERLVRIVEIVNRQGKVTVAELSEALDVSPVTVRRDLERLEEEKLLRRTHGGAMAARGLLREAAHEKSFSEKEEAFAAEKERIAAAAAALVQEEEALLLTPGTTNMFLIRKLADKRRLTVVTNASNLPALVPPGNEWEVLLIGGKMRPKSFALVGPLAERSLDEVRVDKLFLGVDGFHMKDGLSTPSLEEASVNRRMISIAQQVIVVADHSKFGKVTFGRIASLDSVHTVITDRLLSKADREALEERGIEVILV
ncbi:DeoR/GlpR family DNA-binding transcription regulator [Paenibacillus aurantius]|uniref:DeoR/GlpR family DNA-binding transcription regulator n=1 Tax=Paenibacillus aurantius TaxID=2918900 RepID=A0AA96L9Z2_9BACL|nr:DeoR/GlpR family DNA-binding transcription regulator [Paenibacillus aurantius]WNQ09742.1 DeoR/GlpR family DNA-binding transcription regulator [Paenibacillus aurantius]